MKKLHTLPAALLLVVMLFITACTPSGNDEDICAHETKTTTLSMDKASDWKSHEVEVVFGDVTSRIAFDQNVAASGYSVAAFFLDINNVCALESPLISSTLILKTAAPDFIDSLYIQDDEGDVLRLRIPIDASNQVFNFSEYYVFPENFDVSDLHINNIIYFPYQGSFVADSTYFFGKLDNMVLGVSFKKPN